jgi:hypothetical protein
MSRTLALIKANRMQSIALACALVCVILAGAGYLSYTKTDTVDPAAYVQDLARGEKPVFEGIRDSLADIIRKWGIEGALAIDKYALVNGYMGIYECHVITHLIGHESVIYYGSDYDAVEANDDQFCELGYRHGAEAQVALNGGNYQEELYKMCDAIKRKDPSADCFHGAGHAFMNESLDVNYSLKMCDSLINETHTEDDVLPCYNAVFAELTNLVGGRDGATGLEYTGGPPLTVDEKTPLQYCAKFGEERYRNQCLFEFSGLGISQVSTPADIERRIDGCMQEGYDITLESLCVKSVSAVGAQHLLAKEETLAVPASVLAMPEEARSAYILGAGTELLQYLKSGALRDWQGFCGQFTQSADIQQCKGIFAEIL